jgi:hypothetical protein
MGASPFMREPVTIYAWITPFSVTIYAWITWTIPSSLWTTCAQVRPFMRTHLSFLLMWVSDGLTIRPCSVTSTCTCQ